MQYQAILVHPFLHAAAECLKKELEAPYAHEVLQAALNVDFVTLST